MVRPGAATDLSATCRRSAADPLTYSSPILLRESATGSASLCDWTA